MVHRIVLVHDFIYLLCPYFKIA